MAHHPLWSPASGLLPVPGGLPSQRLWCLSGAATGGPGEETSLPASEEAPELRYAGSRPTSSSGREIPAPLRLRNRPEPFQQYLYSAIDDCTRLQAAWVSSELTPQASVLFLYRLLRTFPFPIEEVQTDHGVEFTYVFFPHVQKPHPDDLALRSQGIRHKLIPVAMPKQNGKVERSHRTLDEECLNARAFRKPGPREHAIKRFLEFYNNKRPHSALGWLTPLRKLQSFPAYRSVTHV